MENSLVVMSNAAKMLAEANTIQKTKELKDLALTAADWAKRKGMGEDTIRYCKSYALEAQRKMGELLKATERNKGAAGIGPIAVSEEYHNAPTLKELGLTKKESSEAQFLADLPDSEFEKIVSGETSITKLKREQARTEAKNVNPPTGKYRIIYADPPWKYGNTMPDYMGVQDDHYPLMSLNDICALPIRDMAEDNSVLFLWVTSPILEDAFKVINSWGFEYKTSFVWDKVKHVMGHYNSVRHEFLLLCIRGSCPLDNQKLFDSVYSEERTEHSTKPEYFRNVIDTIYPNGKRIELFARSKHENWKSWGNEVS